MKTIMQLLQHEIAWYKDSSYLRSALNSIQRILWIMILNFATCCVALALRLGFYLSYQYPDSLTYSPTYALSALSLVWAYQSAP